MSSLFSSNFTIPFPFSFKFKIIKIFGTNPMLLINKSDPVYEKIKRSGWAGTVKLVLILIGWNLKMRVCYACMHTYIDVSWWCKCNTLLMDSVGKRTEERQGDHEGGVRREWQRPSPKKTEMPLLSSVPSLMGHPIINVHIRKFPTSPVTAPIFYLVKNNANSRLLFFKIWICSNRSKLDQIIIFFLINLQILI